jgi:hypothetical protein
MTFATVCQGSSILMTGIAKFAECSLAGRDEEPVQFPRERRRRLRVLPPVSSSMNQVLFREGRCTCAFAKNDPCIS